MRRCNRPSPITHTRPFLSPSVPRSSLIPLISLISSLTVIWLTNRNLLAFRPFSSLPYRHMRKRRASLWHNIHSPSNSRVATPSRPLLAFCRIKHGYLVVFKEVTQSS